MTRTDRNAIRTIIANSREYDASTMRISRDGAVSAAKDADKTFNGPETGRYLVGYAAEILSDAANGFA